MTPQERQLVIALFDRLASLEGDRRDPEAEHAIAEGAARAPNAIYPLVQTVLVQDEALKRADARIQELEAALGETPRRGGGFLDSMRDALQGRGAAFRGSVPSVAAKWNSGQTASAAAPGAGYAAPGAPANPAAPGGSFLGTAAAAAAGVIGGSLLFDGIRSLLGDHRGSAFAGAYDPTETRQSPWGDPAAHSNMAREAGLDDIGGASPVNDNQGRGVGLFDASDSGDDDSGDDFADDDSGFDGDGDASDA